MKKEMTAIILLLVLASCAPEFPEVMTGEFREPLAPCRDTDGGANFNTAGKAIDYYLIHNDYCIDGKTLYEGVCATFQQSAYIVHECENRCVINRCE